MMRAALPRVMKRKFWGLILLGLFLLPGCVVGAGSLAAEPAVLAGQRDDIIGEIRTVTTVYEDTMLDIARNNGLGFTELMAVNPGVDPWIPGEGVRVLLPTAHILPDASRRGVVVNIAELRLYYYPPGGGPVVSVPIGVGREGFTTPFGTTKVTRKAVRPTWYPTPKTRADRPELPAAVPPGPDNPLGEYALYLGWPAYLIHGTNQPYGVGRRVSRGCIRLYPEDIERLFKMVPEGTPVTVVAQPIKLGWRGGDLYIEVNPSLAQVDQIEEKGFADPDPVRELADPDRILAAAGDEIWRLDWIAINQALERRQGIPIRITRDAPLSRQSGADAAAGIGPGMDHSPGSGYRPSRDREPDRSYRLDRNHRPDRDHRPNPAPTVIGPGIGHY